jgi:hypothetical protein
MAWPGYAASAWAFVFAAVSFYWAAGGTVGAGTIGPEIEELARSRRPSFVALLWGTGALKVIGGILALALVRPWGRVIPRRLLLPVAWGAGVLLLLYAVVNLVQHGLAEGGVIGIPDPASRSAVRWHLVLWDPWWLLGGILFVAAAWSLGRRSPDPLEAR